MFHPREWIFTCVVCVVSVVVLLLLSDVSATIRRQPKPQDITFTLFKTEFDGREVNVRSKRSVRSSGFNSRHTLFVVVHDWTGLCPDEYNFYYYSKYLQKTLFKLDNAQVLYVDWSKLGSLAYRQGIKHVPFVGGQTAAMLSVMKSVAGLQPGKVHIIGIGAGAHVAGIAGQGFSGVGRITGVSPYGKIFHGLPADERLSADDAVFVDALHTADESLGFPGQLGTVDFYVHWGGHQLGCAPAIGAIIVDILNNYGCREACSHHRAIKYFVKSITHLPETFLSFRCDSYAKFHRGECLNDTATFGYPVELTARGKYYIPTSRAFRKNLGYPIVTSVDVAGDQGDGELMILLFSNGNGIEAFPLLLGSEGRLNQSKTITSVFGTIPFQSFDQFTYGLRFRGRNRFSNRFRVNSVRISSPPNSLTLSSCKSVVVHAGKVTMLDLQETPC